jgi:tRNA (guanine37-N1)-methyltransferase
MKIDILTLFPNMFDGFLTESIIKRAIENKKVAIGIHNIRDYSNDRHKKVDDTPYGGGAGMVLMCQPIFDAVNALRTKNTKVVLMTPQGVMHNQNLAYTLKDSEHLIFICGHYEGFDERIRSIVDMEISIGDYVLTGGELPSMVVTDSVVRLLDGVIEEESYEKDSFADNLLDYPTYTKPQNFNGLEVPDVLLSGHHENIEKWRQTERIIRTLERRPDLVKKNKGYYINKD